MARKRKVKEVVKPVESVDKETIVGVYEGVIQNNNVVELETTKSPESILEEIENKLDDNSEKLKSVEPQLEEIIYKNTDDGAAIPLEQPNPNNSVGEQSFQIDIAEYGFISGNAEEFVVNALKFYHENKDKVFVTIENEDVSLKDDKIKEINDKIKKFESTLFKFSYLPKSMVTDFINDLKK